MAEAEPRHARRPIENLVTRLVHRSDVVRTPVTPMNFGTLQVEEMKPNGGPETEIVIKEIPAKIAFHSWMIERFGLLADEKLPQLRHEAAKKGELDGDRSPSYKRDKKLKGQYVAHLLDSYTQLERKEQSTDQDRAWKNTDDEYTPTIRDLRGEIKANKERIFEESKSWTVDDEIKKVAESYNLAKKGSREIKESVYQELGLYSHTAWENIARYGGMTAATLAANQAEKFMAIGAGVAVDKYLHAGDLNIGLTGSALAVSYYMFFKELNKNLDVNHEMVKETGIAQRGTSAAAFDFAKSLTDSEKLHEYASKLGYLAPEFQFEITSLGAAFFGATSFSEAVGFLIGANMVGYGWEKIARLKGQDFIDYKQKRLYKKVMRRKMQNPKEPEEF